MSVRADLFQPVSIPRIAEYVARETGGSVAAIMSDCRLREVVAARAVVILVAYEAGLTLSAIARRLGWHHTSVLHILRHGERIVRDGGLWNVYQGLRDLRCSACAIRCEVCA